MDETEQTDGSGGKSVFERLCEHCQGKPDAVEDHPWEETVYKVRAKIFAFPGRTGSAAVTVKTRPDDLDGLLALPFVERAAYVGRYGWVTVRIEDEAVLELALELIDTSYELVAAKGRARRG